MGKIVLAVSKRVSPKKDKDLYEAKTLLEDLLDQAVDNGEVDPKIAVIARTEILCPKCELAFTEIEGLCPALAYVRGNPEMQKRVTGREVPQWIMDLK